jgi:hypothetical protein
MEIENQSEKVSPNPTGFIKIDWGRQGGVILGYLLVFFGYFGIIANTMMIDETGLWISFYDMDRTILFWTFETYISSFLNPFIFLLILMMILTLIILFSIKEWHSFLIIPILIPVLIIFILDIYWNLIYLLDFISTGSFIFSFKIQGLALVLLFLVCFGLTYKEDVPLYGIKASIWLIPLIIAEAFIFYTIMFGFSTEPFILQFGSIEGYINILILTLTVLAGSLSGRKLRKYRKKEKIIDSASEPY